MSDAETLLAIVAAIYLSECSRWLRHDVTVFRAMFGSTWRAVWPGTVIGNPHGGFIFLNPIPLGAAYATQAWPLSVSSYGVYGYTAQVLHPFDRCEQSQYLCGWDDIRSVDASGKDLFVNDERIARCATPRAAKVLAQTLETIRGASANEREAAVRSAFGDTFDVQVARERITQMRVASPTLRMLGVALFGSVFVVALLLVWSDWLWPYWVWLLVTLLSLLLLTIMDYFLTHQSLYPTERAARWKHAAMMFVSPLSAMRAIDAVQFEWLAEFHPLAVAKPLLSSDAFEALARRVLLDLRYPSGPHSNEARSDAIATEAWFRDLHEANVLRILEEAGLDATALVAAPIRENEEVQAYCPRCRQQFVSADVHCMECGGRELVAFPTTAPVVTHEVRLA